MCLTIPKKVFEIRENSVIVEQYDGSRQEMKTMIELSVGDFVLSKQNIIFEKIEDREAQEIIKIIKGDKYE